MDRFQLGSVDLTRNPQSGDLRLMLDGPLLYKTILSRAFPTLYFSRSFEDRFGRFSWGTYIKGAGDAEQAALGEFCRLLQSTVFIDDDLQECFALGFHTQTSSTGGSERTEVGQLVYQAKPYDQSRHTGDAQRADELAALLAQFIQCHPTYRRADVLLPVPASNPNKGYDLPLRLAQEVGKMAGIALFPSALRKTRMTRPMKDCRTVQEKIDNLKDAFAADPSVFHGKTAIIMDDIYQTGFSMNEVGRTIATAGATVVLGRVATKTMQDLR